MISSTTCQPPASSFSTHSLPMSSPEQLSQEALPQPLTALALDGSWMCMVTHQTSPVILLFDDGHQKKTHFLLYKSIHHTLILGFPWLLKHIPHIDWAKRRAKGVPAILCFMSFLVYDLVSFFGLWVLSFGFEPLPDFSDLLVIEPFSE